MTDPVGVEPTSHPSAAPGTVEVWHGADRLWRYRYIHPVGRMEFLSNRGFVSRAEAVDSAVLAYPGVPVVELSEPPYAPPPRRRWRKLLLFTVFTGGISLVVVGVAKLVLFLRRMIRRVKRAGAWIGIAADLWSRKR